MLVTRMMTREDLERLGSAGERMELIDGELRRKVGVSQRHGEVEARIFVPIGAYIYANNLGEIYPSDTQFTVARNPDKVLIPDLAFVRADRVPPEEERWRIAGHAPDLAVEVVSPNDNYDEVLAKVDLYQQAGVPLVWLVHPRRKTVTVYPLGHPPRTLFETDILDGGEVLPGFALPVAEIFR